MGYWSAPQIRSEQRLPWSQDEIDLLLFGRPVPYRTVFACKYMRLKHGIRYRTYPFDQAPYRRLPLEPGKIPPPQWWRTAQLMREEGYRVCEISRLFERSKFAVRRALYPSFRERHRLYEKPPSPERVAVKKGHASRPTKYD